MSLKWSMKKLEELGTLTSSKRIFKKEYVQDGIPFYRSKEVKELAHNKDISLELFITKERYKEIKNRFGVPKKGDILLTAVGTIGEMYVVKENEEFYFKDGNIMWLKGFDSLDSYYLKFILTLFIENIKSLAQGSAYSALTIEKLKKYEILVPPLDEQKQIVAILDKAFKAIDRAKENIEKNLANSKELFQSKLNEIFSQKGEGWEEKRIEDLTKIVTKGSSPKWQGINYTENQGVLFITSENVGSGKLVMKKIKYVEEKFNKKEKKSILKKGDVLTNIVGASIGRTAIYDLDEIANINQAVCIMRCDDKILYNYYLMYLLNSPYFKNILHDNEIDNARANLSLTFFKNLVIHMPNIEEQIQIVKYVDLLSIETKQLEKNYQQKLNNLEELKKSILQKAFNGELV